MFVFCVLEKKTTKFKRMWWWWWKTRAHTENQKAFFLSAVFFCFFFFFWVRVSLQFLCCQFTCAGIFLVNHSSKEEELFFLLDFSNCRPFSPLRLLPHSLSLSLSGTTTCLRKFVDLANLLRSLIVPRSLRTRSRSFGSKSAMCQAF